VSVAAADAPRVVHTVRGRVRVHFPQWSGDNHEALEERIRGLPGVVSARASPQTRNALIHFRAEDVDEPALIGGLAGLDSELGRSPSPGPQRPAAAPDAFPESRRSRRLRIAVRGLDRDADLARRVVERLESRPDVVRVIASPLTSRVLVELSAAEADVDGLLADIGVLELPELPGEDVPAHPLDPAPLVQSTARLVGSALGLGLLVLRRAAGAGAAPVGAGAPAAFAAVVGIVEGLPPLEKPVERVLGHDRAQLVFGALSIASLTMAGGALGLAVAGAGALGLVSEVRARRGAWREYENRLPAQGHTHPGSVVRLRPADRVPLAAEVLDGYARAVGPDGATVRAGPGARLQAGARVYGDGLTVRLEAAAQAFHAVPQVVRPMLQERYLGRLVAGSLAYALLLGVVRRSLRWAFTGLLLVNPRTALIGAEQAGNRASARVLRGGTTVVGTRRRPIRRPDIVLLGCPRVLTDGLEVAGVDVIDPAHDEHGALEIASAVAAAAGSPWGAALRAAERLQSDDGTFDGVAASAAVDGERWELRVPTDDDPVRTAGDGDGDEEPLVLVREGAAGPAAVIRLRPRTSEGVRRLQLAAARHDVRVAVVAEEPTPAAAAVARRAGFRLLGGSPLHERVDEERRHGAVVAVVADSADAGHGLALADLAVALTSGRTGPFLAGADLLAPTLEAVAEIIEAGRRHDSAVRDAVLLSVGANLAGAVWGLGGAPRVRHGSTPTFVGALAALAAGWLRLRGGRRPRGVAERLVDPLPERWGRVPAAEALGVLRSRAGGLTAAEARARWRPGAPAAASRGFRAAVLAQVRSPLIAVLGAGAALSFAVGAMADVALIAAVIVANAAIGAWQETTAGRAAAALERMTVHTSTVLRDGRRCTVPATEIVAGDVVLLAPGARLAGDARLLRSIALEMDEAALTGESLPVAKGAEANTAAARVVLAGTDVVAGTAAAVVVASGADTRLGALAAALELPDAAESPLDARLAQLLRASLPLIAVAGGLVVAGGALWGQPFLPQLMLGASAVIAAVPEGLPLLAGIAGAAAARRLARRHALVRRLRAVEGLGRVDVACADKTGTITEGRLSVSVVAGPEGPGKPPERLDGTLAEVLLDAALASPHPDAAHARSHPTDVAVVSAAERAGLSGRLRTRRAEELPFEPSRSFHAAQVDGRVVVKGAAEAVVPRCGAVRRGGRDEPLTPDGREELLARAAALSSDGLRVLMIAEGSTAPIDDLHDLVAVGFIGIADPLRRGVPEAVRRCREAGVRVVILTGDHPATARSIARQAGLPVDGDAVLTGRDLEELGDDELAGRLHGASVIARITPLDKVRIVEALQRAGHVVAMTGDGVNDAPALRLADVGVAMGRAGTQVARESADVVLADDDFKTMVEALVEGRGFWANMRRSLALLLGGNLGELGLIVGAGVAGLAAPLTTRQVLAVNLVTDVLPATALAVQEPEHRDLSALAREGAAGLDAPLRGDILRRGVATALPSLAAYLAAQALIGPARAQSVAFGSIVATQLGHALDLGRVEGRLSRPVLGAVALSGGITVAGMAVPGLAAFLSLQWPGIAGAGLILGASVAAVALARLLSLGRRPSREPLRPQLALAPAGP
jgi:cation-transporting P-type ATPase I